MVELKLGYKASAEQFDPRELVELGVLAEEHGMDSAWVSDHFNPWRHEGGHSPFALTWMTAVGERTQRVVLGTSVLTPTFRYNPAVIAQAFATMGCLYPGRVVLGVGTGEALNEIATGAIVEWPDFKERFARLRESVKLMRELWWGERVDFDGEYFQLKGASIYDVPEGGVPVFSFMGKADMHPQQVPCWITHTNERTHDIIRSGFDRSPMFTGKIEGVGPRYCPSVEDKINRFADKDSHQIFLEPEGLTTHEYYPNGISTSLPFDIQYDLVRSMKGLENCHILRPGYAIEYDYFDPRALKNSFETRQINGLFFAGQINGTTGYEEAAAQGLFAGINAALQCRGDAAWLPARDQAYLGVLVDDLVTQGVTEPYRMFTSRAEYRLQLREDNADARLTEVGRQMGLVDDARWDAFSRKRDAVSRETERLKSVWVNPRNLPAEESLRVLGKAIEHEHNLFDLLRRPNVTYPALMTLDGGRMASADVSRETLGDLSASVIEQVEIAAKYSGYIDRQKGEVERAAFYEHLRLPESLDYLQVSALSIEARQKLAKHRPETLGQASRISGITPASVSLLLIHLKKGGFKGFMQTTEEGVQA